MDLTAIVVETGNDIGKRLQSVYRIIKASDFDSVSELLVQNEAALVCINANLPNDIAEHICYQVKSHDRLKAFPLVVFDDSETTGMMIKWFEQSCDDFIGLNQPETIILARIEKCIWHFKANRQLRDNLSEAHDAAFLAMNASSVLGTNIQFMIRCLECDNIDELVQLLFNTLAEYQVNCSIQVRSLNVVNNYERSGFPKALETKVLNTFKDCGRFYEFGTRCILNFDHISLLVKDMPVDSPDQQGAIKDNLAVLLQGCNQKIITLEKLLVERKERLLLKQLTVTMTEVLGRSDERYKDALRQCSSNAQEFVSNSEITIFNMGLTETQEKELVDLSDGFLHRTDALLEEGLGVNEDFVNILSELSDQIGKENSDSLALIDKALNDLPRYH